MHVFGPCTGYFAFPDETPSFGAASCPESTRARVCSSNTLRTICRFGPFMSADIKGGWWLVAQSEEGVTQRFLNLSPHMMN